MARFLGLTFVAALAILPPFALGEKRTEHFDVEPPNWEGVNHRNAHFEARTVTQDFGFRVDSSHAGGKAGEVGGTINPAAEPAYYAFRLPKPLTLSDEMKAEGKIHVAAGAGHFHLGFFHPGTLNGWRTPNTIVARINGRGETFHAHVEYATSRWRAGAGVVGSIIPGERINASDLASGQTYLWKLAYDPKGGDGRGEITLSLGDRTATCLLEPEHRRDGLTVTHFGLLPVLKSWDTPGEAWLDDVSVQGTSFDFSSDPKWDALGNRATFMSANVRPKFDFGWSATHHAGGQHAGELGGLIFRGDCREPHRMAAYGDPIGPLTWDSVIEARGKVAVLRAVSDSTASIGFYHSVHSMKSNPSQKNATPMDFLGINIEGPSSEGFFFYPLYRSHGEGAKALGHGGGKAPRIEPDGKTHDWFLRYDPVQGRIAVGLDGQTCQLDIDPAHRAEGAAFDRFGICTPWIDGNSVTAYFDDLTYTFR